MKNLKSLHFAVIVSRYNQSITQKLLDGALTAFKKHGVGSRQIRILWVPGAFEIPIAAKKAAQSAKIGAVVCLGCVLEGETSHNRYISQAVANGIIQVSLETGVPVTFGVLTPNTVQQARERSQKNSANKGTEAAEAAIEMASLLKTAGR